MRYFLVQRVTQKQDLYLAIQTNNLFQLLHFGHKFRPIYIDSPWGIIKLLKVLFLNMFLLFLFITYWKCVCETHLFYTESHVLLKGFTKTTFWLWGFFPINFISRCIIWEGEQNFHVKYSNVMIQPKCQFKLRLQMCRNNGIICS